MPNPGRHGYPAAERRRRTDILRRAAQLAWPLHRIAAEIGIGSREGARLLLTRFGFATEWHSNWNRRKAVHHLAAFLSKCPPRRREPWRRLICDLRRAGLTVEQPSPSGRPRCNGLAVALHVPSRPTHHQGQQRYFRLDAYTVGADIDTLHCLQLPSGVRAFAYVPRGGHCWRYLREAVQHGLEVMPTADELADAVEGGVVVWWRPELRQARAA